jgi:hypothetical protein
MLSVSPEFKPVACFYFNSSEEKMQYARERKQEQNSVSGLTVAEKIC